MVQKSGIHQLRLVVYPIILKVANTSNRWFSRRISAFYGTTERAGICITGFGAECEDQRKLDPKG